MLVIVTRRDYHQLDERYALDMSELKTIIDDLYCKCVRLQMPTTLMISIHHNSKLNPSIIEFDLENRWIFDSKYA